MAADGILLATERFIADALLLGDRWVERPTHGGWSPAEITEHVGLADRGIASRLAAGLEALEAPATALADDEIPYVFYRGDEPPGVATPTGSWTDPLVAVEALAARAEAIAAWARDADLDLRAHGAPHPVFGTLDAAQWLLFAQAHTERHRAQLIGLRTGR